MFRRKIVIKKDLDLLILFVIMFQTFFGYFLGIYSFLYKLIAGIILIRLFLAPKKYKKQALFSLGVIFTWLIVIVGNAVLHNSFRFFRDNILSITYTIVIPAFLVYLVVCKSNKFYGLFTSSFGFINIYALVNIIIIFIQLQGNGFLMNFDLTTNTAYFDHIAGLQGMDGTHRWGLLSCFIIIYDCVYLEKHCSHKYQGLLKTWIIIFAILSLYTSSLNDNKFFFILLPIFLIEYYCLKSYYNNCLTSRLLFLAVLGIIVLTTFSTILSFEFFENSKIGEMISQITSYTQNIDWQNASNNNERISILIYVFMATNVFGLGKGVGEYSFFSSDSAHGIGWGTNTGYWGTANLGPFIYAFGIPVCIILVLALSLLISKAFVNSSNKHRFSIASFMFLNYALLMFYGKIMTFQGMMINYCFMLLAASDLKNNYNYKYESSLIPSKSLFSSNDV